MRRQNSWCSRSNWTNNIFGKRSLAVATAAIESRNQSMKDHIVGRYRGYVIEARIERRTTRLLDGVAPRYCVTWSVRTRTSKQPVAGVLADPLTYDSESVALTSVDRKARAFIDAMLVDSIEHTTGSLPQL
jgi:hypothetical protein